MNKIELGRRLHCILYGGNDGTIVHVHGTPAPESVRSLMGGVMVTGGRASVDVVWDDGTTSQRVPEAIVMGVQWRLYDEVVGAEAVTAALKLAEETAARLKREADEEAARKAAERTKILADNPHLQSGSDSSGKLAAANIRTELKKAFPKVKFSVRKESYGSLRVNWIDGPTEAQVVEITSKYRTGDFDGMDDSFHYNHAVWPSVFGGAQYIFTNRAYSDAAVAQALDEVCAKWGMDRTIQTVADFRDGRHWYVGLGTQQAEHHWNLQSETYRVLKDWVA